MGGRFQTCATRGVCTWALRRAAARTGWGPTWQGQKPRYVRAGGAGGTHALGALCARAGGALRTGPRGPHAASGLTAGALHHTLGYVLHHPLEGCFAPRAGEPLCTTRWRAALHHALKARTGWGRAVHTPDTIPFRENPLLHTLPTHARTHAPPPGTHTCVQGRIRAIQDLASWATHSDCTL